MDKNFINIGMDIVRSVLYALVVSVFLVLGVALIIRYTSINSEALEYINQGVKVISIFIGMMIGIKSAELGIIKGAIVGLLYTLISYLVFMLLSTTGNALSIFDILLGTIIGAITGVLLVNIKSKNRMEIN